MLKNIIIFAVGACVGAGATYIYMEKTHQGRLDEEIQSVKDHQEERIEREVKKRVDEMKVKEKPDLDTVVKEAKEKYKDVLQKTNYQSFAAKQSPKEPRGGDPYIISFEAYTDDDDNNYEKEVLVYYDEDDVLATESEELVDVVDTIGAKNAEAFGQSTEEAMYVRNDKRCTDYEVIRVNSSYSMMTGSVPEDDD